MSSQYDVNPRWIQERTIDFKALEFDFMPGFRKEQENYKKAIIYKGRDQFGRLVKDATWPRDPQPNEIPYYNFLKEVCDENWKFNPAKDEKGNIIKETGIKHIVENIIRIRTTKGENLISLGKLVGYDGFGNIRERVCHCPEQWYRTWFKFVKGVDSSGRFYDQCLGPSGGETVYDLEFTKENLRDLVKKRAGDNIPFTLKDETKDSRPRSVRIQGSIDSRVKFFLQDFDYLYNEEYLTKEQKARNRRISEIILAGRANSEQEAAEIAELEQDLKQPITRNDVKTGVA